MSIFYWNILLFLVAWACDSSRVIFHAYCLAVAYAAGISIARTGIWDGSSGDTCQCHPDGVSGWLAMLRPLFNFLLLSGKKINERVQVSLAPTARSPCCAPPYLLPPTPPAGEGHSPPPSEGSGNPYLGFIRREVSLAVQKWLRWRCGCECLWLRCVAVRGTKEIFVGGFFFLGGALFESEWERTQER